MGFLQTSPRHFIGFRPSSTSPDASSASIEGTYRGHPHLLPERNGRPGHLRSTDRALVRLKDAFLDQFIRFWPVLQLLFQAIGPHVLLEIFLMALKRWSRRAVGKDVAFRSQACVSQVFYPM